MLKYIQLHQVFDSEAILKELDNLSWVQHYNKQHYSGDWSVISLRSPGGREDNIVSVHAGAPGGSLTFEDTMLLKNSNSLRQTLDFFQCKKTMVRLMKLNAGAKIHTHSDHDMNYESGEARFHIPIITNERVGFVLAEEELHLTAGSCWYLNLQLPHSVSNNGDTDRIHLVIDCIVNDWIHQLFSSGGVRKESVVETEVRHSIEEARMIIAHLREMNTPVSLELAKKMEEDYGV